MTRTIAVFALVLTALAALPIAAQEVPAPRFFIERIEVRNTSRVSPHVVVAESRLREGAEYSESELRDAAARLNRLPFLLSAEFSLEKGSERGRHVLVIHVAETRSFFYRLEIIPLVDPEPNTTVSFGSRLGDDESSAALGYRWFLGRRGALHVAFVGRDSTEFSRGYSAFAVGWTQYDLFGTRAFATLSIKDSPEAGRSPQLVVGIPLSLNQTVTAEYDELVIDRDVSYAVGQASSERDSQRVARLTWSYNTTNHPFVPTEGVLFSAGPIATWRDETALYRVAVSDPGQRITYDYVPLHTTVYGVEATALRYWEISDRNSVNLGLEARFGYLDQRYTFENVRSSLESTLTSGTAQTGFSRSLWSPERRALGGDSRLELTLRARLRSSMYEGERFYRNEEDAIQASVSWVRHSSWGTLRLGVGTAW